MRKIILLFLIVFATNTIIAQRKSTFLDNWHLNLHGGPTFFLGDVTQKFDWYKTDFSTPRAAFGLNLTKEVNCWFALRGQIGYGLVGGKKDFYAGGAPANLSFKAHYYHFNAQAKVNFIDLFGGGKCFRRVNLYGFAGLGFINFQTRLYQKDVEILSWGYGRTGTHHWVTEVTVPFGLGVDVRLGQKWRINLDVEAIWVDNEKLDRVSGMYDHDAIINPTLGVSYNISKYNRVCCNKSNNDVVDNKPRKRSKDNIALDNANRKIDSLNRVLTDANNQVNKLNDDLANAATEIEILKKKKDTVFLAREGTQYPDSINKAMDAAGYIWYNVYFDLDKYDVKPMYNQIIANVAAIMKKEPAMKIRVVGNADQQGNSVHNEWLSKNRSQQVIDVLVNKFGIDRNRLILEYHGDKQPISKIHFEVNRRVDFIKVK
jgi:outer membrane protein OmpA-like peptidoglycan-associated protein